MHTPVYAYTCIMHSSSPTRTAQKYRTSRSHLHKYSEHEGLISGEKAFIVKSFENLFRRFT